MRSRVASQAIKRQMLKASMRADHTRTAAFRRVLLSIPEGKVSSYGKIAAAAGYPMYQRAVAQMLRSETSGLPWKRVVGAGGEIKLRGDAALEQRLRLGMEGVTFRGKRVNMERHEHVLRSWEIAG